MDQKLPGLHTSKGNKEYFGITTNFDQKLNENDIENLMIKHDRSLFFLKDIKEVNSSKTELNNEMSQEFAK